MDQKYHGIKTRQDSYNLTQHIENDQFYFPIEFTLLDKTGNRSSGIVHEEIDQF